ncbi:MAG: tRNA threonylcarbamoyladenosine biosynthesis protein TsaB [Phycisphaerae bacterium]|nr:tRNA threonylcarbamoyladenosine biosynthesis protein TsaB [Phycisphaerae bacterium]
MTETREPTACVLAIETSSGEGGVALASGGRVLAQRELPLDRRHTSQLLPAIGELVSAAGWTPRELTSVYFSAGPGSFTGLRLAATTARMLQWSVGCQVVACPTLEVIARNSLDTGAWPQRADATAGDSTWPRRADATEQRQTADATERPGEAGAYVAPMLDAKREQVFAACYRIAAGADSDELIEFETAGLRDPATWLAGLPRPLVVVGTGLARHRAAAEATGAIVLAEHAWRPRVEQLVVVGDRLARRGRFCLPQEIVPTYIRPPEAEEVYETRRAAARDRRGE